MKYVIMPIQKITCFPFEKVGDEKSFCTKLLISKAGSNQVAAAFIEEWLVNVAGWIFGPHIEIVRKDFRFKNPLIVREPLVATLVLLNSHMIPRRRIRIAVVGVTAESREKMIMGGKASIAAPV